MRFGKTLQASIYPPWRDHYIDYTKLKQLLREVSDSDDSPTGTPQTEPAQHEWTEHDESRFVHELINVQLEKVHSFQLSMNNALDERTSHCEQRLEKLVAANQGDEADFTPEQKAKVLKQTLAELDTVTKEINELERFSRINFTGFLKAAKKHDRRSRAGNAGKGKAKAVGDPKVKPLLQVRLSHLEFNKEDYSPLLYRLSTIYDFVRRTMNEDQPEGADTLPGGPVQGHKYTSHKFWVHPDNIIEVKTFVLRRLPVLVYNPQPSKELNASGLDPIITSLYFDNPKFELYTDKVLKTKDASSLRLRWYGQLKEASEIFLERKTIRSGADDSEGAVEERVALKEKYINDFINGKYSMEKTVQKIKDRKSTEEVEKYQSLVSSLQTFIQENDLQPVLRASYTRTAFQIPGDDRIRVSLDTDLALIREDSLDSERPCREPENWHRQDIDDANMEYPFSGLRKGEIVRFPYALLEIKVRETELQSRTKEWVQELMSSHLVHGAPRFSKFLHGVAVLFDDYVNSFPFWLGDLEQDIRKDPRKAWDAEQERKKKQNQDETAVGSFRPSVRDFGGRGNTPPNQSLGGYRGTPPNQSGDASTSRFPKPAPQGTSDPKMLPREEVADVEDEIEEEPQDSPERGTVSTLDGLRQLFPSFSSSRYGRAHSKYRAVVLPAGVKKPTQLIMYTGEVKVEAKVWLANQRTFIKWMHIVVLLASVSVALYNAADPENHLAKGISVAYTAIAIFAGVWGWAMYMWRSTLIRQRSGRDFDSVLGPVVVCIALAIALVANFTFKYRAVMEKTGGGAHGNATVAEETVEELRRLMMPQEL